MSDVGAIIESSGCSKEYFTLENCLGEHDRDFRACKAQMDHLKKCSDEQRLRKTEAAQAALAAAAAAPKKK